MRRMICVNLAMRVRSCSWPGDYPDACLLATVKWRWRRFSLELHQSALRRSCHARQRILLAITLEGLMSCIAMMHSSSRLKGGWRLTAAPVCLLHGKVTVPGVRFIDSTNRGWPNVIFEAHRTDLGFVSTWAYYCWEVYITYTVSSFFLQPRLSSSSECHTNVCWGCHFSITGCFEFESNCCLSSLWPLLSV